MKVVREIAYPTRAAIARLVPEPLARPPIFLSLPPFVAESCQLGNNLDSGRESFLPGPPFVREYPLGVKRRQFAQAKRRRGYILAVGIVVAIALVFAIVFWQFL